MPNGPRIPAWSEIAKAGDAFDLKSFDDMADATAQDPIDSEQVKTGSKARVHEGYASGAKSTFDPEKFVPVKNGEDGKFAPGTGFYFTNLGADGLSDYYHDHSKIYANPDGSDLDRSGVAFTLDPKTHISIRNNNDYRGFLQKYHRFYDYSKGEGDPVWGVLPDWEAAARDGVGSVQFPYESLKHTDGGELYGEYWSGPNGERGQPQYIYNHPNEGLILRPEAVVTQRPYKFFEERNPNAKDESTADRHLAGLTPDGKKFMEEVYERQYSNPRELKFWHGYARAHPEMSLEELRNEYGGLLKSVKSIETGSTNMTDNLEIPTWEEIKKSIANRDTAGYLHEKYKPYPGYISERRNEKEGPHQPSIQSAIDALTSQQAEDQRIRAERQDTSEAGWGRGRQDAQAIIDQYKGKIPDEEIIEMLRKLQEHAAPTDFRATDEGLSPDEQYYRAMNYLGYVENMDGKYNDFFAGDRTGGPGEDPVVSAVRNNVHHQESLRNNRDERLDMGRSYGVGHRRSWFERDSEKEKKEGSEQTDSSSESKESAKKSEDTHIPTWDEIRKSTQAPLGAYDGKQMAVDADWEGIKSAREVKANSEEDLARAKAGQEAMPPGDREIVQPAVDLRQQWLDNANDAVKERTKAGQADPRKYAESLAKLRNKKKEVAQ